MTIVDLKPADFDVSESVLPPESVGSPKQQMAVPAPRPCLDPVVPEAGIVCSETPKARESGIARDSMVAPGAVPILHPHQPIGHLVLNVPSGSNVDSMNCGLGIPSSAAEELPLDDSVKQSFDVAPAKDGDIESDPDDSSSQFLRGWTDEVIDKDPMHYALRCLMAKNSSQLHFKSIPMDHRGVNPLLMAPDGISTILSCCLILGSCVPLFCLQFDLYLILATTPGVTLCLQPFIPSSDVDFCVHYAIVGRGILKMVGINTARGAVVLSEQAAQSNSNRFTRPLLANQEMAFKMPADIPANGEEITADPIRVREMPKRIGQLVPNTAKAMAKSLANLKATTKSQHQQISVGT
ncbi:hypothetical protein Nepgr_020439 [Nepenthes gracilis]|uniref:Uncharacterized protein n=1 Tax=Nepenthes gracilis TaxID=150966 RepID=A0AAD3XV82_NEPGR|nr:hypothetical protein Nepgr_020439 [Nepenthes gracilis]